MTPARQASVRRFAARHARYRIPEISVGRCVLASTRFARLIPGARVLHLVGCKRRFPGRVDGYPAVDRHGYHCVVVVGGTVYDWTRRQFDPRAEFPHIEPLAATRRDWCFWTTSESALDRRIMGP